MHTLRRLEMERREYESSCRIALSFAYRASSIMTRLRDRLEY